MNNKLDSISSALAISGVSLRDAQPASNLLVLVPESGIDPTLAARAVWELATTLQCRVQLLGLSADAAHESALRRQLVIMTALIQDGEVSTQASLEFGNNWLGTVKEYMKPGDRVVCFHEQWTGFPHRPLGQMLESNLQATVYVLSGFDSLEPNRVVWRSAALAWFGPIVIILAFFWAQMRLGTTPQGGFQSALFILSILLEGLTIWAWNSLFG